MEEEIKKTTEQYKTKCEWLRPYQWKKGQTGNPLGIQGKKLKTFVRELFEGMSDSEKIKFLKHLDPALVWQMAEGRPKEEVEVSGELNNPFTNLTDEQKLERIRLFFEGIGKDKSEKRPDIPDGGDTGIPEVQPDTPGSGEIPVKSEEPKQEGDTVASEKPLEDNGNNNRVGDTAVNQ